jgi:hypothetical protein
MMFSIRVILQFNQSFGRKLVVSHITLSMFDKILVYVWSWCGGLNEDHSISIHLGPNSI